ncbi:hypothetical protein [Ligilactobacillus equi]|uniref:Uncharacterized protein n=1 Tax=Ligilactobacillus equi DSM 15833 = JCM 10991 TaxID=1423740 RepID=A0A0R1TYX0_9LACO|nr:hypothetical protein [Ligilactobacillus equi]KRL84298.1 hypothetical protein FC36_GL000221 [Ligilactobacillus equi DSM 15833 = JCM 10991]
MANISDIKGRILIDKQFYLDNKDFLDNYFSEDNFYQSCDYGIFINAMDPKKPFIDAEDNEDKVQLNIIGNGRWTLLNSYNFAIKAEAGDENYHKLIKLFSKNHKEITVDYDEYEPGISLFGHFKDILTPCYIKEDDSYSINPEQASAENYDYNDRELIEKDFEDGYVFESSEHSFSPDFHEIDEYETKEFINDYGETWYDNLRPDLKKQYSLKEAIDLLIDEIIENEETKGGISFWRCEDTDLLNELFLKKISK